MHGGQVPILETIAATERESLQKEDAQQGALSTACTFIFSLYPISIAVSEAA